MTRSNNHELSTAKSSALMPKKTKSKMKAVSIIFLSLWILSLVVFGLEIFFFVINPVTKNAMNSEIQVRITLATIGFGIVTFILLLASGFIHLFKKIHAWAIVLVLSCLLIFGAVGTVLALRAYTLVNKVPQTVSFTGQEVFDAVNKYRKDNGVGEIKLDDRLCNNLAQREIDIEAGMKEGIAHKNLDEWYKKYVPQNIFVSEDADNNTTIEGVIKDWDSSPGHRLSILDPKAKIGCSYAANNWAVIEIGYVAYTPKKTVVSQTPTPNPNDPNRIVQCSISATCGGGIRDVTASECDKITCCQTASGWIVTSKDNCNQTQKSSQTSNCISGWEDYRTNAIKTCNISLSTNDYATYQSCMDNVGKTANAGIAKCSQ